MGGGSSKTSSEIIPSGQLLGTLQGNMGILRDFQSGSRNLMAQYSPERLGGYLQDLTGSAVAAGQGVYQPTIQAANEFFNQNAYQLGANIMGGQSARNSLYSGAAQTALGRGLGQLYGQTVMPAYMGQSQLVGGLLGQGAGQFGGYGQMGGQLYGLGAQLEPYQWAQPAVLQNQEAQQWQII